jgi:hypothetical protein
MDAFVGIEKHLDRQPSRDPHIALAGLRTFPFCAHVVTNHRNQRSRAKRKPSGKQYSSPAGLQIPNGIT